MRWDGMGWDDHRRELLKSGGYGYGDGGGGGGVCMWMNLGGGGL